MQTTSPTHPGEQADTATLAGSMDTLAGSMETLAGSMETLAGSARAVDRRLLRGEAIGRYVVLELVGEGGMGEVYAAYDPELDRKVALKLVRGEQGRASEGPSLLQREAQAMAKLAHPNVIAVHDVGVFDGRVFIAMEFVDGQTLSGWLASGREWTEVVEVFVRAGSGLVAAHAVGLVHRDFKPDNVLIGHDGRVRVMDFGLARADERARTGGEPGPMGGIESTQAPTAVGEESLDATVTHGQTQTGALQWVGTPAFMAPEQFRGERADARADQFSFCVALYSALYGQRPFVGANIFALAAAVGEGRLEPPPKTSPVPGWLRAVVLRGLALHPSDRFASMQELLAAIEAGRRPATWPRVALAIGIGIAVLTAVFTWPRERDASDPAAVCAEALDQLDAAWNPGRRDALRETLRAAQLPEASLLAAIDDYASGWTTMRRDSCEATRVTGTQSDELMDLRRACLDQRRSELGATVDLLTTGNRSALAEANRAIENLVPLTVCADEVRLRQRAPIPSDPEQRAEIEAGEQTLARARARLDAGLYAEVLTELEPIPARALEHAPLAAAAAALRGRALHARGEYPAAEQAFARAELEAARGGDDRLLVEVAIETVSLVGVSLGKTDEAARIEHAAEVALTRIGRPRDLDLRLRIVRANLLRTAGKPDAALASLEALRQELQAAGKGESMQALEVERRMAALLANLGHYDRAQALIEGAIAELEQRHGVDHPALVVPLINLGAMFAQRGEMETAHRVHARVIALAERRLGPDHPDTAVAHESLGVLLHRSGRDDEARVELERAASCYAGSYDESHPSRVRVGGNLASVLIELGELGEAERVLLAAQSALRTRYGDEHDYLVFIANNIAELYILQGRHDEALATIHEAERIADARLGPQSERAGECRAIEGRIHIARGDLDSAIASLEQARSILIAVEASPLILVDAEGWLALALVRSGARDEGSKLFVTASERARASDAGPTLLATLVERAASVGVELLR